MTGRGPNDPPRGFFALPQRRPWAVILSALLIAALSVLLIRTIETDGSLASMLPQGDSSSAALALIAEDFDLAQDATLLVSLPEDDAPDATELVAFAERFAQAVAAGQADGEPKCRVTFRWPGDGEAWTREVVTPNLVLYLDDAGREALRDRLTPQGMAEQMRMNERAAAAPGVAGSALAPLLEDPLRLRELVASVYDGLAEAGGGRPGEPMLTDDGRALLIRVTPVAPTHDAAQQREVMSAVQRSIDAAKPGPLRVQVGGGLAIAQTAERTIRSDMIASSVGTIILLQILFLLTYRRLLLFPIAFIPAAVGVLVGFGVFALTGRALSPPTAVLGALLAGLGIDYAIHYLAHAGHGDALHTTSRRLAGPLGMACVTSVIAFLTLMLSDVAALRDFATIGAVGLGVTLVTTLLLLPALLKVLGSRTQTHDPASPRWRLDSPMQAAIAHQRIGLSLTAVATLTALVLLAAHPHGPVRFDTDLGNMHPQPNAALDAQHDIADAFPGRGEALMLYLSAPSEQALIQRAEHCRQRLATHAQAKEIVVTTYGLDRLIPSENTQAPRRAFAESIDVDQVLTDFDVAVDRSIFQPTAFTGYRASLGEILRPGTGPTLATLEGYPGLSADMLPRAPGSVSSADMQQKYHAVTWVFIDGAMTTRQQRGDAIVAIRDALMDVPGVTLTGMTVVGHDVESAVRRDLPWLLGIAACVVALWLALCLRNVRDTALALLPVSAGLLLTFAAMLVGGVGLNLLNLVALPLLAGLGIDDGVFLVAIARDARRRGASRGELLRDLAASAQAVTLTSATTALAFGSLVLTGVPAIRSLGVVMAMGIAVCLVMTIVALAPLLVRAHPSANDTDAVNPAGEAR